MEQTLNISNSQIFNTSYGRSNLILDMAAASDPMMFVRSNQNDELEPKESNFNKELPDDNESTINKAFSLIEKMSQKLKELESEKSNKDTEKSKKQENEEEDDEETDEEINEENDEEDSESQNQEELSGQGVVSQVKNSKKILPHNNIELNKRYTQNNLLFFLDYSKAFRKLKEKYPNGIQVKNPKSDEEKTIQLTDLLLWNLLALDNIESLTGTANQSMGNYGNLTATNSYKGKVHVGNDKNKDGQLIHPRFLTFTLKGNSEEDWVDLAYLYLSEKIPYMCRKWGIDGSESIEEYSKKIKGYAVDPDMANKIIKSYNFIVSNSNIIQIING